MRADLGRVGVAAERHGAEAELGDLRRRCGRAVGISSRQVYLDRSQDRARARLADNRGLDEEQSPSSPKGRTVDPNALATRCARCWATRRASRDLLIEHLHRINDRYGHLPAAHLAALAQEMSLSLAEVYEVATFYHHFEVVKEGEDAAAGG